MNTHAKTTATKQHVVWEPDIFSFKSATPMHVVDVPCDQPAKKPKLLDDLEDLERERLAALISSATSDECGVLTINDAFIDRAGAVFVESAHSVSDTCPPEQMVAMSVLPFAFQDDLLGESFPIAGPLLGNDAHRNAGVLRDIGGIRGWNSVFVERTHRAPLEWTAHE